MHEQYFIFYFLPLLNISLTHHRWMQKAFQSNEGFYVILQVQLLIYFMLKYAMEILLSESSVVTTYYFGWTTGSVSIFLASLGLTVLPVNIVVGSYISNMYEDR